jgi:hypothetical protein
VDSILTSTKKILGIDESYTDFDIDIVLHINSVFSTLQQLGIGPEIGFAIEDDTSTWDDFLGTDPRKNNVKSYMYLRVRLLFDPPVLSYMIDAMRAQITELEWRMNAYREETAWVDPDPELVRESVLDGGEP